MARNTKLPYSFHQFDLKKFQGVFFFRGDFFERNECILRFFRGKVLASFSKTKEGHDDDERT